MAAMSLRIVCIVVGVLQLSKLEVVRVGELKEVTTARHMPHGGVLHHEHRFFGSMTTI